MLNAILMPEPQVLPLFVSVEKFVVIFVNFLILGYKGGEYYQENVSFCYKQSRL